MAVLSVASRQGRLGIFQMECAHRLNRTLAESSLHLGTGKSWLKMASESFLNAVVVRYRRQIGGGNLSERLGPGLALAKLIVTVIGSRIRRYRYWRYWQSIILPINH